VARGGGTRDERGIKTWEKKEKLQNLWSGGVEEIRKLSKQRDGKIGEKKMKINKHLLESFAKRHRGGSIQDDSLIKISGKSWGEVSKGPSVGLWGHEGERTQREWSLLGYDGVGSKEGELEVLL